MPRNDRLAPAPPDALGARPPAASGRDGLGDGTAFGRPRVPSSSLSSRAAAPPHRAGDAERIERLCVERGLKMTGQRRLIARVLSEAQDHPDVEEVYRRALLLDSKVSIATVYRTVRLFEERGILERHDFGGGRARYEPTEHGHHHHLIDVDTGQVVEFEAEAHERLAREIAAGLGFELVGHRLELFGRRAPEAKPPSERALGRAQRGPKPPRGGTGS